MKKILALSLALAATLPIAACNKAPETTAETNDAFANEAGLPEEGLGTPADNAGLALDNGFVPPADNAALTPIDNTAEPTGNAL